MDVNEMSGKELPASVSVTATARLHMGFLDMNGGLGRRFGSIGLSLEAPAIRLTASRADGFAATGPGSVRAVACAERFASRAGIAGGAHLALEEIIPEHAGLGSGTQMALAVGVALTNLYGLPLSYGEMAAMTGRGARSGIGIGAFAQGGLLVDGGRGEHTRVPPVIARTDFPDHWRILLVFDRAELGVHGTQELDAFRMLPTFPAETAADICRRTLMQALPAIAERDLVAFGKAIHAIQCHVGDHFAAAQGGGRYTSPAVGAVLDWLMAKGVGCVGQSSWGPTGFAVLGDELEAQRMMRMLKARYGQQVNLGFMLCKARNQPGEVRVNYAKGIADAVRAANQIDSVN